jgi:hypothetical protein
MATYVEIEDEEVAPEAPVTTSLMTRLRDNALAYLGAPTGTRSLFQQTAAPLGWEKDTTHNNKAVRLTTGTVGSGGVNGFTQTFAQSETGAFTLLETHLPSLTKNVTGLQEHNHNFPGPSTDQASAVVAAPGGITNDLFWRGSATANTGGNSSLGTLQIQFGGSTAHKHAMDMRVQYVDFIIGQKAA